VDLSVPRSYLQPGRERKKKGTTGEVREQGGLTEKAEETAIRLRILSSCWTYPTRRVVRRSGMNVESFWRGRRRRSLPAMLTRNARTVKRQVLGGNFEGLSGTNHRGTKENGGDCEQGHRPAVAQKEGENKQNVSFEGSSTKMRFW